MTAFPKLTALIPMKWHSQRVPGKNVRPLCGKPLYHWIVEALLQVPEVERIVIETDSERIAEDAMQRFPVTVLRRPRELLGNHITINPLLDFHLSQVDAPVYLQTHSTNPLLGPETIRHAIEAYRAPGNHDSLFSVTAIQQRFYWPDGRAINHDPNNLIETQRLTPLMVENSCLYIFTKQSFYARHHRIGEKPLLFPTPPIESVDIDNESDFTMAEKLMSQRLVGQN
jgi:N-acylneuraminate cytidylyltransferase